MSRKEKAERTDAVICRKEILALQGKIRRLESEKNAALARLRQLDPDFRTFEKIEAPAEKALRQCGDRFQDMVERINDWVWEVDPNGVYTYASPRVRDFLGYDPEELIGKTPFDLMPETEAKRVGRIFREFVEKRQPFCAIENTNLHKNGLSIVLETNGVPFFD